MSSQSRCCSAPSRSKSRRPPPTIHPAGDSQSVRRPPLQRRMSGFRRKRQDGKIFTKNPKKSKKPKKPKKPNLPSVFFPFPPASTSSLLVLRLLLRLPCVDTMPPPPLRKKQKKNEPSCEPVSERASAPRVQVSSERESRLELRASESCVCVCGALFGIFCVLCVACARACARASVSLFFSASARDVTQQII